MEYPWVIGKKILSCCFSLCPLSDKKYLKIVYFSRREYDHCFRIFLPFRREEKTV